MFQKLTAGLQKQVGLEVQRATQLQHPVDFLAHFVESFSLLLNSSKVSPLNIIRSEADVPISPDALNVIDEVMVANMKLL